MIDDHVVMSSVDVGDSLVPEGREGTLVGANPCGRGGTRVYPKG